MHYQQIMKKLFEQSFSKPVSSKIVIKILLVLIIILSYVAGFYHSSWQVEVQKNQQLQSKVLPLE